MAHNFLLLGVTHRTPNKIFILGYWRQFCPSVKALGMETVKIPDKDIKASAEFRPEEGGRVARLHNKAWLAIGGGWVPVGHGPQSLQQWLQVDFEKVPTIITHVATQGRDAHDAWVKKYKLQYLDDSNELVNFRAEGAKTNFTVKAFKSWFLYDRKRSQDLRSQAIPPSYRHQ